MIDQGDIRPTRAAAIHSAGWAAFGSLLRYALAGITTLILTRLLDPGDFGLVAITYAAQELIAHVAPVGFHDALIQRPRLEKIDLDTAFWSITALAGGFTLLTAALAVPLANWFDQPPLAALLVGMALAALLRALSFVPRAMLARRLDFRTPTLARAFGLVIGGVCAILVASLGGGAWSLVAHVAVINLVGTILIWRAVGWRPGWRLSRAALGWLWRFALSVSIFTVLVYIRVNADDQLIGYRLGPDALGFYTLAYAFMAWPTRDVVGGVAVVLYPVLARFQADLPRLRAAFLESVQLTTAFTFPTLALLIITAPVLISWLLGERWQPVVLTAQILALGGIRDSTMMLNGLIYRVRGKPHLHTLLALCNAVCYVVAFVVGLDFGIAGVAFFYVLAGLLLHPVAWWLLLDTAKLSPWAWLRALLPVVSGTVLMSTAAVLALHCSRSVWGWGDSPALIVTGITAGTVYGLSLWIFTPVALRRALAAVRVLTFNAK